jgi:polysaccharide biosynthesis protein PslH
MNTARILIICPDIPYPIIAGGHMRMASLIPAIAAVSKVHVCFVDKGQTVDNQTVDWFKQHNITYSSYSRKRQSGMSSLLSKVKMILRVDNFYWNHSEQNEIDKQIKIFIPDCIWLETPYQIRYVTRIRKTIPVIVDYWGLLSEGSYRDFLHAPLRKKYAKLIYWLIATSAEKKYATMFPYAVSVSSPISAYLQKIALKTKVFTVPNGIVKMNYEMASRYESNIEIYDLIMTGDFSFAPNIDAALFFTKKILPIIRKDIPDVILRFSGRNPVEEIKALDDKHCITVSGYVDDLMKEIAEARVYILPLRMGSGIRSKLFDVFPLGKPIVVTSTGAEGLELINNDNSFIADTPENFAERCIELLRNPALRSTIGSNAKKLATQTYAQGAIEQKIANVIDSVMEGRMK